MKTLKYISVAAGLLFTTLAYGQEEKKKTFDESVDMVQSYKPKLSDAVKIEVVPVQENIDAPKPDIKYNTPATLFDMQPFQVKLKAPGIGRDKIMELKHNYLSLGFGNYANAYGEFFYNTLRNRNSLLAFQAKHHSGRGPVDTSGFSEQRIGVYGKKLFKNHLLDASVAYERNANHYYGQTPGWVDMTDFSTKVRYSDFNLSSSFNNAITKDEDKLKYNVGLDYYNFSSKAELDNGLAENDVTVKAGVSEPFNSSIILLTGTFDYMNLSAGTANNRTLLKINGAYKTSLSGFKLYLGLKTANETDTLFGSKFHFYPDVRAEINLAGKYLMAFGGLTGDLEKNTYRSLAYENPFIDTDIRVLNTNKKFDLFAGIKGSLSSKSSYLVSAGVKNYEDMYFYMNGPFESQKFVPVYDTGNTAIVNLHAELGFAPIEKLSLNTAIDFNKYSLSTLAHPYHRPALSWILTGNYNIQDKIMLGTDIFLLTNRFARVLGDPTVIELKPVLDVNAKASYALANVPGMKIFLELNNILGNKYQYWNFYPVRGFQVVGGLHLSFL